VNTLAQPDDKAAILRRLRTVRPDSERRWGRMSAHQMVCHLSDAFRAATGEKTAAPASGVVPAALLKWIALRLPLRWPAGIRTRPEMDQERGGTRPVEFGTDVAQLEALVERFTANPSGLDGRVHPRLGPMSLGEWLRWGYLHMDHHLRQFGA
jgi:hypothetical protein